MLQMGGDFGFENANAWFKNLDKLIEAVNREGRVHVSCCSGSTPSDPILFIKKKDSLQRLDRRFRRNSYLQAVCDTSIARVTGCVFIKNIGGRFMSYFGRDCCTIYKKCTLYSATVLQWCISVSALD